MRVFHFSDCHLGFSRYYRTDAHGYNVREMDVERAFAHVIDAAIVARPDVVVVAGDLFHASKPGNRAIVFALEQFGRLRTALPATPVIIVSGNHDDPKMPGTGHILRVFRSLGIHVAISKAQRFEFPDMALSVLAVPECATRSTEFTTAPARYNIMVFHGAVAGVMSHYGEDGLSATALNAPQWDYLAMGDYHVHHQVAPNAWYSGATEYTSSDCWREARAGVPKGYVIHDLDSGSHEFRAIPGVREHVDLEPVQAHGLSGKEVDEKVAEAIAAIGGVDGKVVRLVAYDLSIEAQREEDHTLIRKFKSAALHFQLDARRPERKSLPSPSIFQSGLTVDEMVQVKLRERFARSETVGDIDQVAFLAQAADYMRQAGEVATPVERELENSIPEEVAA